MSEMSEQIWYRSSLYRGKSFSLYFKCKNKELASKFENVATLTSSEELPCIHSNIDLFNREFLYGIATRIAIAIFNTLNFTDDYTQDQLMTDIDNMTGITKNSLFRYFKTSEITSQTLTEYCINYRILDRIICLSPDIREDQSLDVLLHSARVSGKSILLPIDNYTVLKETDEISLSLLDPGEDIKFKIFRGIDLSGTLHNKKSLDEPLNDYSNKKERLYNITLKSMMTTGLPVYRDVWHGTVIQLEGIIRLSVKFIKTAKIRNESHTTKRVVKNKKINAIDISYFLNEIKDEAKESILKKIKTKLPRHFKFSIIYDSTKIYNYENVYFSSCICTPLVNSVGRALYQWDTFSSKQKKNVRKRIAKNCPSILIANINNTTWMKHESLWFHKFYTEILKPSEQYLNKGEKDESSTSITNDDNTKSNNGSLNRQATGLILRTTRGSTSFSCGEPFVEDARSGINENDRSENKMYQTERSEIEVPLRLGSRTRTN